MTRNQNLKTAAIKVHREESGSSLVEFAISCLLFLVLVFGIAEFSLAIYSYHFVSYSAQQAARYAIVRGSRWSSTCASANSYDCSATATNVQDYVRGLSAPLINPNEITVKTTWPGTTPSGSSTGCTPSNKGGCVVDIQVSYPFNIQIPLVPSKTLQFSSSAEMVIQE